MFFTTGITGKIIRWFLYIKGPGGWARLAIKLALEFKKLIFKWLRRNLNVKKIKFLFVFHTFFDKIRHSYDF